MALLALFRKHSFDVALLTEKETSILLPLDLVAEVIPHITQTTTFKISF